VHDFTFFASRFFMLRSEWLLCTNNSTTMKWMVKMTHDESEQAKEKEMKKKEKEQISVCDVR